MTINLRVAKKEDCPRLLELVHELAFETEKDGEGIPPLFQADAFGEDGNEAVGAGAAGPASAADAKFKIFDAGIFLRALGELDHAGAM